MTESKWLSVAEASLLASEMGLKMIADASHMILYIVGVSLALRHDGVFFCKFLGRVHEWMAIFQVSGSVLTNQAVVPILSKVLSVGKQFLLRTRASIFPGKIGRALPKTTAITFINVNFSIHYGVLFH